jgi:hypothetical protein
MMRRIGWTTAWLVAGHAVAGAAYVALINTPESNVLMLTQSAILVLIGVTALVVPSASAAVALHAGRRPWAGLPGAVRLLPPVIVSVAVIGLLCAAAGWTGDWWVGRSGEVDAALIAAGDITRTDWLHEGVRLVVAFLQWVVVPAWLAVSLAWAAAYGARHVLSMKWLVAGLRPRLLVLTLAAVAGLVWLPWSGVYWRPAVLPAGTLEMAFTGLKLLTIGVLANLAWAVVLDEAVRPTRR